MNTSSVSPGSESAGIEFILGYVKVTPIDSFNYNFGSGYKSHFPGKMTGMAIYDRALSASEILENYNHGRLRILGIK